MKYYIGVCAVLLFAGMGCAANNNTESANIQSNTSTPEDTTEAAVTYDANSWKTMIDDSCQVYSDGCNTCRRAEGSDIAACTKKFCATYEKPVCLDEPTDHEKSEAMQAPFDGTKVSYQCDGGETFTVFYDEYVSGDAKMKLDADTIMISDTQRRTAYRMTRTVSASGEKYEDESGRVFWSKGSDATVMVDGEALYEGCVDVEK